MPARQIRLTQDLVLDVEKAIASGDADRRRAMLRRVTSLFTQQASRLDDRQVAAFDAVLLRLSRRMETAARAELSTALAPIPNAPGDIVRDLAFDEEAGIAGPVIERSVRLADADLVEIASSRSMAHLMSMTRRTTLSERVTDMLVQRGTQDVVRSLAGNSGARFSRSGYSNLLQRSEQDLELRRHLDGRSDLPASVREALTLLAQQRATETLSREFGESAAVAVSRAAEAVRASSEATDRMAEELVDAAAIEGTLDESTLVEWLDAGNQEAALIGLARMAGTPAEIARLAFGAESYEPLLYLVRSAPLGLRILRALMSAKSTRKIEPEVVRGAAEAFQALSIQTARRIVRFTVARHHVQNGTVDVEAAN